MINLSLMSVPTPSRFGIISPDSRVIRSAEHRRGGMALARNEGLKLPYTAVDTACCHKQAYEA